MKKIFREPSPFELYLPERSGLSPFPLICITPLLGRIFLLEDLFFEGRFAAYFQNLGFAAALIHRPIFEFDPGQGLKQLQTYLTESVERNKKILDRLRNEKEIDPERIGSFGISFGAVVNCLWAACDPRLKANVFALGGGNLPEIFIRSRDYLMKSYRKAALKNSRLTIPELRSALEKVFETDPLKSCAGIQDKKNLLILALLDRVIPFHCGMALRNALGNPPTIFLPLGHYTSLLVSPILKRKIAAFLAGALNVGA